MNGDHEDALVVLGWAEAISAQLLDTQPRLNLWSARQNGGSPKRLGRSLAADARPRGSAVVPADPGSLACQQPRGPLALTLVTSAAWSVIGASLHSGPSSTLSTDGLLAARS